MTFWQEIEDHVRRVMWGRTREESLRLAAREALERRERYVAANLDENGCYIVHAPDIWGGYCEAHKRPVYDSVTCFGVRGE